MGEETLTTVHQNFISGCFIESAGGDLIDVFNPARDTRISQVPDATAEGVNEAVAGASRAQRDWERLPAIHRVGFLREISAKIRANAEELARVISEVQGKILPPARFEAAFTADHMAEWARQS